MTDTLENIKKAGAVPVECCGTCKHVRPGWDLHWCIEFKHVTAEFMRCERYKKHAEFVSKEFPDEYSQEN